MNTLFRRLLSLALPAIALPALAAKPNILFIVADDLGWADVGWHGSALKTPQMDKLVAGGVELDRHYVQPVCTPTRTALMSGRWTSRWGRHVLYPSNLRAFPPGTTTMAVALKQAGYETYLTGKWHLGSKLEWGPNHYGFDHSYGSLAGAVDPWAHTYRPGPYMKSWHRDDQFVEEEGNATELVAAQACRWIRAEHNKPWFIYVPFQAVHIPIDAPEQYKKVYAGQSDDVQRYGGFVSQFDAKIGEFVAALEETGQRKNTLIVFTSDNGGTPATANPYAGKTPPLKKGVSSNLPLRGQKGQLYEGGIRVPAFANWPGVLAPRKVTGPMHVADWMPTLTRLAGWKPLADPKFDGQDVWPMLNGIVEESAPRTLYIPLSEASVVLDGEWKLIAHNKGKAELFHITADPFEKQDRAAAEPARVEAMMKKLTELRRDDAQGDPPDLNGAAE